MNQNGGPRADRVSDAGDHREPTYRMRLREGEQGHFLPGAVQDERHIELDAPDRAALHLLLGAVHRAVHRGRGDLAAALARSAAQLCRGDRP